MPHQPRANSNPRDNDFVVTIFVSGSGTDVGKTRVTGTLARVAVRHGCSVQVVKPVQTGVAINESTDAELVAKIADLPLKSAHTLRRYHPAIAPLAAAKATGETLDIQKVIQELLALPMADVRLVEGGGGIAVPLARDGYDWTNFAEEIQADAVVLVVPDELGAINQSRLTHHYLRTKTAARLPGGIFLNALKFATVKVQTSNRQALDENRLPLWGELAADSLEPILHSPLAELLQK